MLKPKANLNPGLFAESLLELKPVREVFLTDGDFGYLVKVKFTGDDMPEDVDEYIKKKMQGRFGRVDSYYQYRK